MDAGKTTLCESMLFFSNCIRKKGRVDEGNSFFDFNTSEKQHGITLYSKEASFKWGDADISIIDTPGHRDFATEVERALPVLDVLLFVVSAYELKKQQNIFLFNQLTKLEKPILVFVSKMDMDRIQPKEALSYISSVYSEKCIEFKNGAFDSESAAMLDDAFFEAFLENKPLSKEQIDACIFNRSAYPVILGSGLNGDGVSELLDLIARVATIPDQINSPDRKSAYVYKIDRDDKGVRQTHIKILSGKYSVRDEIVFKCHGKTINEKINEIRQISGAHYQSIGFAEVGDIAVFTGLSVSSAGQFLDSCTTILKPYEPSENPIEYSVQYDKRISQDVFMKALRQVEEENPELAVTSSSDRKDVFVHLKGDLAKDVLQETFEKRFGINIQFGSPKVDYYETIQNTVYGNGHYEPLKHYAEVRLRLTPLAKGSGIVFESKCSEDILPSNWQHIILNSIASFNIRGVLIGAPLTDVKVTLLSGRYHIKHTEGGDFREAVIRAIRQGLMKADSVLLEPHASFLITCPSGMSGKVITDLDSENLKIVQQAFTGDGLFEIQGNGSLLITDSLRKKYMVTYGDAVFFEYTNTGLKPCQYSKRMIEERAYNPEADIEQSPDSVFCFHGAGHSVKWNEADELMHTDPVEPKDDRPSKRFTISEKELNEILEKNNLLTKVPEIRHNINKLNSDKTEFVSRLSSFMYLIDGSNLLHAYVNSISGSTKLDAQISLQQDILISDLVNYVSFTGASAEIVFDGFNSSSMTTDKCVLSDTFTVIYSGAESADIVLERLAASIGPDYRCKMVTSDQMVQISALHSGIIRISSREFLEEMSSALSSMREKIACTNQKLITSIGEKAKM